MNTRILSLALLFTLHGITLTAAEAENTVFQEGKNGELYLFTAQEKNELHNGGQEERKNHIKKAIEKMTRACAETLASQAMCESKAIRVTRDRAMAARDKGEDIAIESLFNEKLPDDAQVQRLSLLYSSKDRAFQEGKTLVDGALRAFRESCSEEGFRELIDFSQSALIGMLRAVEDEVDSTDFD